MKRQEEIMVILSSLFKECFQYCNKTMLATLILMPSLRETLLHTPERFECTCTPENSTHYPDIFLNKLMKRSVEIDCF
jgi:hypothetical protein